MSYEKCQTFENLQNFETEKCRNVKRKLLKSVKKVKLDIVYQILKSFKNVKL